MFYRRGILFVLAALALALTGQGTSAADKPIEIVFSTYMPTSYGYLVQPLIDFMAEVEQKSNGRVTFKFFHSGQLYKARRIPP